MTLGNKIVFGLPCVMLWALSVFGLVVGWLDQDLIAMGTSLLLLIPVIFINRAGMA